MEPVDPKRFDDAGAGLGAHTKLMAHLAVAIDEYVIELVGDDPSRVPLVLAEMGMTRTASLLGVDDADQVAGTTWRQMEAGARKIFGSPRRSGL